MYAVEGIAIGNRMTVWRKFVKDVIGRGGRGGAGSEGNLQGSRLSGDAMISGEVDECCNDFRRGCQDGSRSFHHGTLFGDSCGESVPVNEHSLIPHSGLDGAKS